MLSLVSLRIWNAERYLLMCGCQGLDAADHIAEEIQNAPAVIPLSMGVSTTLNGVLGFSMLIALMFCVPSDINSTLESVTYYPFMTIYQYAVGSTAGATAMVSITIAPPLHSIAAYG